LRQIFPLGKPKLQKFAELSQIPIVFERNPAMKGRWAGEVFKNNYPVVLELACGKGDYSRGMAALFPEKNFIGVDIKGNRLWTAAKLSEAAGLNNVAFIREQIDLLGNYFTPGEVSEVWITFPDPFPRSGHAKKRLTSPRFLQMYRALFLPGTRIYLKTDSDSLYEYTLEMIELHQLQIVLNFPNLYAQQAEKEAHGITTYYESLHLREGKTIKLVCFTI